MLHHVVLGDVTSMMLLGEVTSCVARRCYITDVAR